MTKSNWPKPAKHKIGDVARMLGTNASTLRYYERSGLLTPQRSAGGTRLYNDAEVARFEIALRLTSLGFPLADLVALARIRPGYKKGRDASPRVLDAMFKLRAAVINRRTALDQILLSIDRAETMIRPCLVCPNVPTNSGCPECPCSTRFEESSVIALPWSVRD